MKLHTAACLAATLVVGVTGCTTPQATTRGQSVHHVNHHDHNVNTLPMRTGSGVNSIQNYFHDQHVYGQTSSYHSASGFPGYSGFGESGAHGAACPPGGCRSGHCGHGGHPCGHGCGHGCGVPHHYHSYSYERPANLAYPSANAIGGSVVYPYYTHKGPSDFFRDDCTRR